MTLPTTHRQITAKSNTNTKKCHHQEDSQEDNAADDVNACDGVEAINGNKAIVEAVDGIKAVNTSKDAKVINIDTEVKGMKVIKNTKGDVNLYSTALIHSLNVHEDEMDATITAEKA